VENAESMRKGTLRCCQIWKMGKIPRPTYPKGCVLGRIRLLKRKISIDVFICARAPDLHTCARAQV
jgi:hypothetical protein